MDVCAGSRRSGGDGNMLVMAPDNVVIDCICLVSALKTLSHTTVLYCTVDCICLVSALNTLSHTTNSVFTLHS